MVITYHGGQFFKVQQGDILLAFNPPASANRFGATIGLSTLNDSDFNGLSQLSYGEKNPLLISGPGEYELKGIFIQGFGVPTTHNKKEKINTIYYVTLEGMRICFLGALSKTMFSEEIEEAISEVDLLFVPVGGGDVLSPVEAYKVSQFFESKIIIPMQYGKDNSPQLKKFLDEAGEKITPVEKLTIRKSDFEGKEGEVAVLKII